MRGTVDAASPRNGGEDTVQKYYELRDARAMSIAKGAGGAAVSLLTAWLIPFLKNEFNDTSLWLVLVPPTAILLSLSVAGMLAIRETTRVHRSLIRALVILQLYR